MLVNCNSCQKKFSVPDSAIKESGRLLQCGYCGNKWMAYPIIKNSVKKIEKKTSVKIEQPNNVSNKKTLIKKKKREIKLYSDEYLKKKYGLTIKNPSNYQSKKQKKINFNFSSYVFIIIVFIITFFGVLNLTKDIVSESYPTTVLYFDYLYEFIDTLKIKISELVNSIYS